MFMMMILSYTITAFLDLRATFQKESKKTLIIYFALMTVSCAIGIATRYIKELPSPAGPIRDIVFAILGK